MVNGQIFTTDFRSQMGLLTHDKTSKSSSVGWSKETKKQNKENLGID